ncbi:MAG TPA: hypothetical protein PKN33_19005 [Phycisphaerae bacterium]|nr:hypothetical protein [Phycisphaerae bacterium]
MRGFTQIALAVSLPLWLCACTPDTGSGFVSKLTKQVGKADRIAIYRIDETTPTDPGPKVYESTDRGEIESLFATVTLNDRLVPYCKCFGDLRIELFEGQDVITELHLHHGSCFRWKDGPFNKQAKMTDKSQKRFERWLEDHHADMAKSDE